MHSSKFIELLRKLSPRETTRFQELSDSPFFNKNQKLRSLISFCLSFAPNYEAAGLDKGAAYRHIFGRAAYEELRLNNLISDALQLAYQFLALLELEKQPQLQKRLEVQALLDRRASKQLRHSSQRLEALTERLPHRSFQYQRERSEQEALQDRYALLAHPRRYSPHLQRCSDALDRYYWCNKLRIACDMASRNRAINADYECHFLDTLMELLKSRPPLLAESPALQSYNQALLMLSSNQPEHYRQLRELLRLHHQVFAPEELQDLYDYAQNYCVRQINSGREAFYQDILSLYQEMLERDVLLRQGCLTQWSYINIVTAGIRLKAFAWTERFIHDHRAQLPPEVQANVFTYSLAALQFEQRQYSAALETLQGVEFSDAFYHTAAKTIQLKSYYELDEEEALFSLLEASRKYIKRNQQLSAYQKQSNANFLRIITRLQRLRAKPTLDKAAAKALLRRIDELPEVAHKEWLLSKVAAL